MGQTIPTFLFNCCFILLFAYSQQGFLPSSNKALRLRPYIHHRNVASLQVSGKDHQISRFENYSVRKSESVTSKPLRHFKKLFHNLPASEFDPEGVLFLSKPKNKPDRALNTLMNKLVESTADDNEYLRENKKIRFSKDEVERLKVMLNSLEDEDPFIERSRTKRLIPEIYMNFEDLVQK